MNIIEWVKNNYKTELLTMVKYGLVGVAKICKKPWRYAVQWKRLPT